MKVTTKATFVACVAGFLAAALSAGTAASATLLLTDGGSGNPYGDTGGFVVDFDSSFTSWQPALVAGKTYSIDSISIWEASGAKDPEDNTPVYLSAFGSSFSVGGFDGDTSDSHLGHSDNAIDHTATPDTSKITYTFTNLLVTADSDGSFGGSGLVYFTWDDDTTRNNFQASGGVHPYQRIDLNPSAADPANGAAVYAFGIIQGLRVPEIEISVTEVVPEPSAFALIGLVGFGVMVVRRRTQA